MEALFSGSSQAPRRFPVEVTELGTDGQSAALGAATVRGWQVEHPCGAPPLALRVALGGVSFRAYETAIDDLPTRAGLAA